MSFLISFDDIDGELSQRIANECTVRKAKSQYSEEVLYPLYFEDFPNRQVHIPLGMWDSFYEEYPNDQLPNQKTKFKSKKKLLTKATDPENKGRDQDVVYKEAMKLLKTKRVAFLALPTGFGKTSLGNIISCGLNEKTLVICFNDQVKKQWGREFELHSTARVQVVEGKYGLDPRCNVYIIGALKASKMDPAHFIDVGTVIFDEAHICTVTVMTKVMQKIKPQYLIGLSATPKRSDGLHSILDICFGGRKNFIKRKAQATFTVYKVITGFTPTIKFNFFKGKNTIDWTTVISSLAFNPERQKLIVDLIMKVVEGHSILVLSGRVDECKSIVLQLEELGIDTDLMIGTKKTYRKECNVLVAGIKKGGVGFDAPERDTLFIVTDVVDNIQLEGRMRQNGYSVYDLVDNYKTLERHYKNREKWYLEKGGVIQELVTENAKTAAIEVKKEAAGPKIPQKSIIAAMKREGKIR